MIPKMSARVLLSVCAVCAVWAACAAATRVTVRSVAELEEALANSTAGSTEIVLEADLDFNSATLPLGMQNGQCVPFSGVLDGNWHTIQNAKCEQSGLFCDLNNTTIKNLVLGDGCSFGSAALRDSMGALSGTASGSITVMNVQSNAQVASSMMNVGGLIGEVQSGRTAVFANITITSTQISCSSQGPSYGLCYVGGLVGSVGADSNITVSKCWNSGTMTGSNAVAGGLIGLVLSDTVVSITASRNDAPITYDGMSNCLGGLVGRAEGSATITVRNSTNTGDIFNNHQGGTTDRCGGLVGDVSSTVRVTSSANTGVVFCGNGVACGLVCSSSDTITVIDVKNSVNKGQVSGKNNAYGIAEVVYQADNVVSMSNEDGLPTSGNALWERCEVGCSNVFVEDKVCQASSGCNEFVQQVVQFTQDSDGTFVVTTNTTLNITGQRVDELLNEHAGRNKEWKAWSSKLVPVTVVRVWSKQQVASEQVVDEVQRPMLSQVLGNVDAEQVCDGCDVGVMHIVDKDTQCVVDPSIAVGAVDVDGVLCHSVVLRGAVEGTWFVEHNQTTTTNAQLASIFASGKGVFECQETPAGNKAECGEFVVVGDVTLDVAFTQHASSSSFTPQNSSSFTYSSSKTTFSSSSQASKPAASYSGPITDVVIDVDNVTGNVTKDDIWNAIVDLVPGEQIVDVEIVYDDQGRLSHVVVSVAGDKDSAQVVVDAVESIDKGEECKLGVLCFATDVFVVEESASLLLAPTVVLLAVLRALAQH